MCFVHFTSFGCFVCVAEYPLQIDWISLENIFELVILSADGWWSLVVVSMPGIVLVRCIFPLMQTVIREIWSNCEKTFSEIESTVCQCANEAVRQWVSSRHSYKPWKFNRALAPTSTGHTLIVCPNSETRNQIKIIIYILNCFSCTIAAILNFIWNSISCIWRKQQQHHTKKVKETKFHRVCASLLETIKFVMTVAQCCLCSQLDKEYHTKRWKIL